MYRLIPIIGLIIGAISCLPVQGQEAEFIAAALADQESACGASLEVEYTGEWVKSVGNETAESSTYSYRYVRTASFQRIEVRKQNGIEIVNSYGRSSDEFRILQIDPSGRALGRIGSGIGDPLGTLNAFETVLYHLYEGPLRDRIRLGVVGSQPENIDGYDCTRVEIPSTKSTLFNYVVWVDPSVGFNPRRIEFVWKDKQPTVVKFSEFALQPGGAWIPGKQTVEYVSRFNQAAAFKITNIVTKVAVGQSIPDDQMRVSFPAGAEVQIYDGEFTVP